MITVREAIFDVVVGTPAMRDASRAVARAVGFGRDGTLARLLYEQLVGTDVVHDDHSVHSSSRTGSSREVWDPRA